MVFSYANDRCQTKYQRANDAVIGNCRKPVDYAMVFLLLMNCCLSMCVSGCNDKMSAFESDVEFLRDHVNVVVLKNPETDASIAVVPEYQGRIMTSTTGPDSNHSFGWINRDVIKRGFLSQQEKKGTLQEHIYIFGGEDRFWIGPEGGQYSIYFEPGKPFDFENWKVPPLIDTEPFELVEQKADVCRFAKTAHVRNYSGTEFDIEIDRTVRILTADAVEEKLSYRIREDVQMVGYESLNSITNIGAVPWLKQTGLLSIWILGMFRHSPGTTIIIPFKPGDVQQLGQKVKDDYFGTVPADRLIVQDDVLFFKADGEYRSKIGVSSARAQSYCGSYDADNNVLTIVWYNRPQGTADYVNSAWQMQDDPYSGDVVNAYNDGSPAPGMDPLGPFYELETSSPALELSPGENVTHIHLTIHLTGPYEKLDGISNSVFGVSLDEVKNVFD